MIKNLIKKNKPNLYTAFALLIAFLLPVLVIPTINNPFFNSKGLLLFVLVIGTLLAYIIASFKEKKWLLNSNPLVLPLVLFGGSILLSTLITHSEYPYDQLLGWGGFFLSFVLIIIFAPSLIKQDYSQKLVQILNIAGVIVALNSVFQLFDFGLSQVFNYLSVYEVANDLSFNLTGGVLLNVQLLSSLILMNLLVKNQRQSLLQKIIIAVLVVGLGVNIYAILPGHSTSLVLLPLPASLEIARNSLVATRAALFGYGPNSYGHVFSLLKPAWLNTSSVWQYNFDSATIFPLTLVVSGGLLALISWIFFATRSVRLLSDKKEQKAPALKYFIFVALAWQVISPLNVMMLTLLAIALSFWLAANIESFKIKKFSFNNIFDPFNLQPHNKANRYTFTAISIVSLLAVIFLAYQIGLNYAAHVAAYQATQAASKEDFNLVFAKQEQSRNLAIFSADWRRIYASSALELAVALSNKTDITPVEQEQVMGLVNLAITEAREAIKLEPNSYQNWLVLANIYLLLTDVTEDARQLAFEALSQATLANPNDPFIRISLGQFYMGLEQWEQASNFFLQAVERKPDLAVAYYNLAQAYVKNEQILEAETALQQALLLIDKETDLEDYTTVETQLATVSEQADQIRAQAEEQQAQAGEQSLPSNLSQTGLVDLEGESESTGSGSGLSDLLDEEETSNLLREGSLIPEGETVNQ
ncbi:MAG: tetratricopeptide repeat protein [Candidatus Pacebacteria bacterium]|nr:tetratricopeptide repeat protein [Candidatus Paceibacterota bacterium]